VWSERWVKGKVLARLIAATLVLALASAGWAREVRLASPKPTPSVTPLPADDAMTSGATFLVGDCDGNHKVAINELITGVNIALDLRPLGDCSSFDLNGDSRVTINELIRAVNNALNPPPTPTPGVGGIVRLLDSSPRHGEGGVALTRETILRFSAPLDRTSVTESAVFATFAGRVLDTRLHLSPDGSAVTLFYNGPLPASARVRITVIGDQLRDVGAGAVDADGDGEPGGTRSSTSTR